MEQRFGRWVYWAWIRFLFIGKTKGFLPTVTPIITGALTGVVTRAHFMYDVVYLVQSNVVYSVKSIVVGCDINYLWSPKMALVSFVGPLTSIQWIY